MNNTRSFSLLGKQPKLNINFSAEVNSNDTTNKTNEDRYKCLVHNCNRIIDANKNNHYFCKKNSKENIHEYCEISVKYCAMHFFIFDIHMKINWNWNRYQLTLDHKKKWPISITTFSKNALNKSVDKGITAIINHDGFNCDNIKKKIELLKLELNFYNLDESEMNAHNQNIIRVVNTFKQEINDIKNIINTLKEKKTFFQLEISKITEANKLVKDKLHIEIENLEAKIKRNEFLYLKNSLNFRVDYKEKIYSLFEALKIENSTNKKESLQKKITSMQEKHKELIDSLTLASDSLYQDIIECNVLKYKVREVGYEQIKNKKTLLIESKIKEITEQISLTETIIVELEDRITTMTKNLLHPEKKDRTSLIINKEIEELEALSVKIDQEKNTCLNILFGSTDGTGNLKELSNKYLLGNFSRLSSYINE